MRKCILSALIATSILFFSRLSAQNVGIGEPNPGSKLSINGGMSVGPDYSTLTAPTGGMIIEGTIGLGTSSPDTNSIIDMSASSKTVKLPRLSAAQRMGLTNPSGGMFVFDTDSSAIYFYDGKQWQTLVNLSSLTTQVTNITSGNTSVSNTISANNLTTTVNGVSGTAVPMVNSISNTSSANNLTTMVNGVSGTAVPMVNSISNTSSTNNLTTTVNGVSGSAVPMVNSISNTSSTNNLTTTVNGVSGSAVPMVNSISNTSSANTLSTTVNGVSGSTVNIINTHSAGWTQSGGLNDTVNGVRTNITPASGTVSNVLGYNSSGAPVYTAAGPLLTGNTTVSNTSSANSLTTTVDGVTGSGVNIINTHSAGWTLASGLSDTVNGVRSNITPASGTLADVLGYNSSGAAVYSTPASLLSSNTTNTLGSSVNTMTSTVNGVVATSPMVNSVTNTSSVNNLTTTVNGVSGTAVPMVNSISNTSSANTLSTTVNGVTGSAVNIINTHLAGWTQSAGLSDTVNGVRDNITPASGTVSNVLGYNSSGAPVYTAAGTLLTSNTTVSNTSSANSLSTTVDGVTGSGVNIINTHSAGWTQSGGLSDTVNGIRDNVTPASGTVSNVLGYNSSGAPVYTAAGTLLTSNTTVSNTSSANSLSTTVDGVTGSGVNIINTHSAGWTQSGGFSDTVNGIRANVTPASGTVSNVLGYNSSGAPVYTAAGTLLTSNTTVSNTSSANSLSTTVDGVTGSGVNIINTHSAGWTLSGGLSDTVNGVRSNITPASGTLADVLGYNSSGAPVYASMNSLGWSLSGNSITDANFLGTTSNNSLYFRTDNIQRMAIDSAGNVGIGSTPMATGLSAIYDYPGHNVITIENSSTSGYSSMDFWNSSGALSATFGFANSGTSSFFTSSTYMNCYGNNFIITTNSGAYNLFILGTNGYVGVNTNAPQNQFDVSGSVAFGAYGGSYAAPTNGMIVSGEVGIGTSSPTQQLDVNNGNILIDNSNNTASMLMFREPSSGGSNYIAFKAASMAANVIYTWPTADGTNGQVLSTDGSGTLSWVTAGSGSYINNSSTQQSSANFNISGNGTIGAALNVGGAASVAGSAIISGQLAVDGNFTLGTNSTQLHTIVKGTGTTSTTAIAANTTTTQTFSIANAPTTGTAFVSPSANLNSGLVIAYAYVSSSGNVTVGIRNTTSSSITPTSVTLYITVIE